MFESLQEGLSSALRTLSGKARLTESNMRDGLRLVKQSLLEADVSFPVVKQFMDRVSEQAVGEQVLKSLRPEKNMTLIIATHDAKVGASAPRIIELVDGQISP